MADNYISVDTSKRLGNRLRRSVELTREALTLLTEIRDIMDESTDGVVYTTLESIFGLPSGKGGTVHTLVTSVRNAVQSAATINFINRLG